MGNNKFKSLEYASSNSNTKLEPDSYFVIEKF